MTECQFCGAKTQDAYLCRRCQDDLHALLKDLPWWIERLFESAVGQVRLGDTGPRQPPDGLIRYTDLSDGDETLDKDLSAGKFKLDKVLAAGGVNARATRQLDTLHAMLKQMVDRVRSVYVQTRWTVSSGLAAHDDGTGTRTPLQLAVWLAYRTKAIVLVDGAGKFLTDLKTAVESIERIINRPVPMRFLGPCPTWLEETRTVCGVELRCRQDAPEVYCRKCRQVHNPDRLQLLMMGDLERKKLTFEQIRKANLMQPVEYRIPERTLRWWRQNSKLTVRGWKRPDGREAPTWRSDADEPLYLWPDIRKLRAEKGKMNA